MSISWFLTLAVAFELTFKKTLRLMNSHTLLDTTTPTPIARLFITSFFVWDSINHWNIKDFNGAKNAVKMINKEDRIKENLCSRI